MKEDATPVSRRSPDTEHPVGSRGRSRSSPAHGCLSKMEGERPREPLSSDDSSFNIHTFFQKFAEFAEAPNAVAKMRELVLELAVTGKLVPQDNRDVPASTIMENARKERSRLVAGRRIKNRPSLRVESDERPFEVHHGVLPAAALARHRERHGFGR